jgi:hypothetical protein
MFGGHQTNEIRSSQKSPSAPPIDLAGTLINSRWLLRNPDGSIDLYIQNQSPGDDRESNWLPAPAGKFILMLRMYWPNEKSPSIIDGTWTPVGRRNAICYEACL